MVRLGLLLLPQDISQTTRNQVRVVRYKKAFLRRRRAAASKENIFSTRGGIFNSGGGQKCVSLQGKGKQQSLEEEIYFSAFYLQPTPLRSTLQVLSGHFQPDRGRDAPVFQKVWKCFFLRTRVRVRAHTCAGLVCVDALVMGTYRNLHIYLH